MKDDQCICLGVLRAHRSIEHWVWREMIPVNEEKTPTFPISDLWNALRAIGRN